MGSSLHAKSEAVAGRRLASGQNCVKSGRRLTQVAVEELTGSSSRTAKATNIHLHLIIAQSFSLSSQH